MHSIVQRLREWFLLRFYADQYRTPIIKEKLAGVLNEIPENGFALNVGSGGSRVHPQVRNLDIVDGEGVDYVADISQNIPLPDDSVDVILTQEVLEHVANPLVAMREISRVLRPGGTLYLQVPFIIGYHPGPNDYWRFTREGIVQLAESSGLRLRETGRALGPATGYYRISVEFWATLLGIRSRRTYLLSKGGLSVLLYPIKFMDRFMNVALEADRIAGGYYVIADKP